MNTRKTGSIALAAAAAIMFSTASFTAAAADDGKVKCEGVNSCKGQGFTMTSTKADCDAAKAKMKASS